MSQHKAASFPGQGQEIKITDVSSESPKEGHVKVKAHAVAINPIDYKIRDWGLFVKEWPTIVGSDAAGEVVEVGSGVSDLKKGDRVAVGATYLYTGNQSEASFQEYVIVPATATIKIPDNMSYVDASVVPLSIATAAAGLYQKDFLALDLPSLSPKSNGKKILVWGGSSSIGASAIQLAVASGYEVITTASQRNFDYVKSLGASKAFDYNSPSVVGDITAELQSGTCVGAYDTVAEESTQLAIGTILAQLGGGVIASVLEGPKSLPATVVSKDVFAVTIFYEPNSKVGQALYQDYIPKALASGQYVPMPKATVFGNGLESIHGALEKHKAGVSATKLVVTL